jgi:hypothetical protein
MDISNLTIKLKHRNAWSAIDLGFLLAREHYWQLLISWMILSLPLFLLIQLFDNEWNFWGMILIWWLKPFWDRGPLYIISKALFAETVSWKALLKQYRFLLSKNAFAWLTYRRLTPARSYVQPVIILEGLTGTALKKRLSGLHYGAGSAPSWLTIACAHFEVILMLGIYGLIVMLIPAEADIDYWEMLSQETASSAYLSNFVTYTCAALIAPFYVCAGFMLYINRRILLEGWDIEIQFRLLASRLQQQNTAHYNSSAAKLIASVCLIGLTAMLTFASKPVYAEGDSSFEIISDSALLGEQSESEAEKPPTQDVNNAADAKQLINTVFKGEDFVNTKQIKLYRLRDQAEQKDDEDSSAIKRWFRSVIDWLEEILNQDRVNKETKDSFLTLGLLVEAIIWLVIGAVIVYILIIATHWYQNRQPSRLNTDQNSPAKPDTLFGFDMRNPHAEDHISQKATKLWQQKDYRAALALMYGALLYRLIHEYRFEFREGFTEQECANLVETSAQEEHQVLKPFVKRITQCWLQVAYAHQLPPLSVGDELCRQWSELFDEQ